MKSIDTNAKLKPNLPKSSDDEPDQNAKRILEFAGCWQDLVDDLFTPEYVKKRRSTSSSNLNL